MLIAAIGLTSPWLIQALSSVIDVTPKTLSFLQRYRGAAIWFGFLLFSLASVRVFSVLKKRLSRFEERLQIVETLPEVLLSETLAANLSRWSFNGQWSLEDGVISVTNERFAGICKIGASWENYIFSFEFNIMHKAAGWIVRAKSPMKYVMIQCDNKQIRPHLFRPIVSRLVKEVAHNISLDEWNKVKTEVQGHSIKVHINETLVFSDSDLLADFPMGTVGFRCWGDEHALFRKIKVVKV